MYLMVLIVAFGGAYLLIALDGGSLLQLIFIILVVGTVLFNMMSMMMAGGYMYNQLSKQLD